jgi:hypothetical protein
LVFCGGLASIALSIISEYLRYQDL